MKRIEFTGLIAAASAVLTTGIPSLARGSASQSVLRNEKKPFEQTLARTCLLNYYPYAEWEHNFYANDLTNNITFVSRSPSRNIASFYLPGEIYNTPPFDMNEFDVDKVFCGLLNVSARRLFINAEDDNLLSYMNNGFALLERKQHMAVTQIFAGANLARSIRPYLKTPILEEIPKIVSKEDTSGGKPAPECALPIGRFWSALVYDASKYLQPHEAFLTVAPSYLGKVTIQWQNDIGMAMTNSVAKIVNISDRQ